MIGSAFLMIYKYVEARDMYDKSIEINHDFVPAYCNKGKSIDFYHMICA